METKIKYKEALAQIYFDFDMSTVDEIHWKVRKNCYNDSRSQASRMSFPLSKTSEMNRSQITLSRLNQVPSKTGDLDLTAPQLEIKNEPIVPMKANKSTANIGPSPAMVKYLNRDTASQEEKRRVKGKRIIEDYPNYFKNPVPTPLRRSYEEEVDFLLNQSKEERPTTLRSNIVEKYVREILSSLKDP